MSTKKELKLSLDKAKLMSKIVIDIIQKQIDDYLINSLEINYELRERMLILERELHYKELSIMNKLYGGMGHEVGCARRMMKAPIGDVTIKYAIGKPNNPHKRRKDVYVNQINYFGETLVDGRGSKHKLKEHLDFQPDYIMSSYKWSANDWPAYYDMMGWDKERYVRR